MDDITDIGIAAVPTDVVTEGRIFCRQYLPDSTIPQGLAKQADVDFCFMKDG
jgi:hypothetical protein